MKKKLSVAIAVVLLLICISPAYVVLADPAPTAAPTAAPTVAPTTDPSSSNIDAGNAMFIDESAKLGSGSNNSFVSGYMAEGRAGGSVRVMLPLRGTGRNQLAKISVTPAISSDDAAFEPSNAVYPLPSSKTLEWSGIAAFDLKIKSSCVDGVYPASFTASFIYDDDNDGSTPGLYGSKNFTVFVRVTGNPAAKDPSASPGTVSMPKLMVSEYTVTPENAMAGGDIKLDLTIKNMSEKRAAQNIEVVLTSEGGVFLPENGTNSTYISKLKAGDTASESFTFKVKPDAESAPASITVAMSYEDANVTAATASSVISIPVSQPIRVRISDPTTSGNMVSEPFSVSMTFINMGKSPLYNLAAEVTGDFYGQTSYYGGTVEAGGQKSIDLTAYVNSPTEEPMQEFSGTVELSYEDSASNVYKDSAPFVVSLQYYVEEPFIDEPVMEEEPPAAGGKLWLWIGIGVGVLVIAGVVVLLAVRNRKRRKEIEDELL